MGDLNRSGAHELIEKHMDLKIQHYKITLNEQVNQLKQLEVNLDRMKSVEMKKIEHQIEIGHRVIEETKKTLNDLEKRYNSIGIK